MKKKWSLLFGLGALLPVAAVAPVLATSCGTKSSKSESTVINEHQLVQKTLTTNTNADAWMEKYNGDLASNLDGLFSNASKILPAGAVESAHLTWPDAPTLKASATDPETMDAVLIVSMTLKSRYTFSDQSRTASVPILVKCTAIRTDDLHSKYIVKTEDGNLDNWVHKQMKNITDGNLGSVVDEIIPNHHEYTAKDEHFHSIQINEELPKGNEALLIVTLNYNYQFSGGHGVQLIRVAVESSKK